MIPEKFNFEPVAGNKYLVDGALLDRMLRLLEKLSKLQVAPPLLLQDNANGKLISLALPPGMQMLRLTGTSTGAGTYTARVQKVSTVSQSVSTDISLATWYGDMNTADDAIVENVSENKNAAGTHALTTGADSFVIARPSGRFASDSTPANMPIWECEAATGLPPGNGKYKVLQLTDDLYPGTPGWDYVRFAS